MPERPLRPGQPRSLHESIALTSDPWGGAAASQSLADKSVRELLGELAALEDTTRGWSAATWSGRPGAAEADGEPVLARMREVVAELRRRRRGR